MHPHADDLLRQLGARPNQAPAGSSSSSSRGVHTRGRPSSSIGDTSTKATTPAAGKPKVLYPYGGGSGLGNRTLDLLAEARSRGAAVGAFTVYSLEGIRAVVHAAEACGRSAILQVRCIVAKGCCFVHEVVF